MSMSDYIPFDGPAYDMFVALNEIPFDYARKKIKAVAFVTVDDKGEVVSNFFAPDGDKADLWAAVIRLAAALSGEE